MGLKVSDIYDQVACGDPLGADVLRDMYLHRCHLDESVDSVAEYERAVQDWRLLSEAKSWVWKVLNQRLKLDTFTTDAALRCIRDEVLVQAVRGMLSPDAYENWALYTVGDWNDTNVAQAMGYFDYYDEWEDIQEQTWAAEESIKITAAAAYAANNQISNPRESAAITPHRQIGGSDTDDAASDDHDSHVFSYLQHSKAIICWTSALEAISAVLPAAKTTQKHTHYIGNLRLELVDYPADFSPDYTPPTLLLAAKLHEYRGDFEQLYSLLDNNAACRTIFKKFSRPLTGDVIDDICLQHSSDLPAVVEQIDEDDLGALARLRDPDGEWYEVATAVAKAVCRVWATDPAHGDDIVHDVGVSTYVSMLKKYDREKGASLGTFAGIWAKSHLRDVLVRLKIHIPRTAVKKRLTLAEQLLARHQNNTPSEDAPAGVTAVWEQHHRSLVANVEKYQNTIGGQVVVAASSLDAPLSDEEDSISVVDAMPGATGDMVSDIERSEVTTAVRECLNNTALDDLIEKIQAVSTKIREDGESDMEYLARVAAKNGAVVKLIKKTIGPDGLSAMSEYL